MGARRLTEVMGVCFLTICLGLVGSISEAEAKAKKKVAAPKEAAKVEQKGLTVSTEELSAFLVKPAEKAIKDGKYNLAVSLWSGIVAIRGDGDESVWKLVDAWRLAGQFDAAAEELERYEAAVTDATKKQKARQLIDELATQERGFSTNFKAAPATKESRDAFKKALTFEKKKQYAEAVLLFRAGFVMDPEVPGNIRKLGALFDKLGMSAEANEYFVRYLRIHPFGKNADEVRTRLAKAGVVGKLTVETSVPCEELWMNGQRMVDKKATTKVPLKDFAVAPGRYKVLCFIGKLHFALYLGAQVKKGSDEKIVFELAIIKNSLDPWGRIYIEDEDDPTVMKDIGLFELGASVGWPVPASRKRLRIQLVAGDKSKEKKDTLLLEPGKTHELKW